jgi:protein involved in polysaccharide export with SLBB domain
MAKKIFTFFLAIIFLFNVSVSSFDLSSIEKIDDEYYISPGDMLGIRVSPADEFSKDVIVSPDGSIELPLVGAIKVAGMKVKELEKILAEKFSKYIFNPKVSISVKKFSSYRVAVIGQIQKSGYIEYFEGMTLLDLIASAGGPLDYADSKNIKVYRKTKTKDGSLKEEIFTVSMDSFFEGNLSNNLKLLPGDIVYIPRKKFTSTTKWVGDNIIPWTMLASFGISIGIILSK